MARKGRIFVQLVLLFVVLALFVTSACQTNAPDPVDPSPIPAPVSAPALTPEPLPEPVPLSESELYHEPDTELSPDREILEARRAEYNVTINGVSYAFIAFEIKNKVYLDIFELASILSGTEKQFCPSSGLRNRTLHLTSESPYYPDAPSYSPVDTDVVIVTPGDIFVFLDGSEVSMTTFIIAGDIYVDFNEISEVFDLKIDQDATAKTINIYTSQTIEEKIMWDSRIDPSRPMIALTYDDGPGGLTDEVLDILEQYDVIATFFVIGRQVERFRETVLRASNMGCEIANHTWSHSSLEQLSSDRIRTQLLETSTAIENVTGAPPLHMRPPYGRINTDVEDVTRELGLPIVFWSVDPSDYLSGRSPERIYNEVMDNVQDRDIILLHDIHERTIEATKSLIPSLINRGFQFVTVSELMQYSGISLQSGESYKHGR